MNVKTSPCVPTLRSHCKQKGGRGKTTPQDPLKRGAKEGVGASIHRELKQTRNPSPTRIEVPLDDDTMREYVANEQVKEGIAEEISK